MRNSIRNRLTWAFIGLAIGPLLLLAVILAVQILNTQRAQALDLQSEMAQSVSAQVGDFFSGLEDQLYVVGKTQRLARLDRDGQLYALTELLSYQDVFETLALLDSQGQELVHLSRTSVSVELGDRAQADEFLIPQTTGETYYSLIRFDETTGDPLMTVAVPLLDIRTGQAEAVLVSDVRLKKIWELIAGLSFGAGQNVYIIDAQDRVVAHRNPSVVLRGTSFRPSTAAIQPGLASVDPASSVDRYEGISIRALVARLTSPSVLLAMDTVQIGDQELAVVAEQTVAEALSLAINTMSVILGLSLLALMVSVSLGLRTVRQIVRPVQSMAETAQAISAGDLSQRVQPARKDEAREDELGVLANAFDSMTTQLQSLISGLEQRVNERTADLEERSRYLEATAEVGRAAASILDADQLIGQVVELIRERFGLYYVGLFLVDEAGEWAVLRAGTGAAGRAMLARRHRIQVGQGMIGWSVAFAEPRVALEAGTDAVRLATTELPGTRSEAALPLRSRGQVLGALSVQATEPGAFDEETMAVLQTMADQVAVAISNAQLFQQAEEALEAERRAYGEIGREAWAQLLRVRARQGYRCDDRGVMPVQDGHPIQEQTEATDTARAELPELVLPIVTHGQVLARIEAHKAGTEEWTEEEIALMRSLGDQLSVALESARLYQDSQRRAVQEQLVGEATARMRETLDIETVLKTTASEMRQALDLDNLVIRLATPEPDGDAEAA